MDRSESFEPILSPQSYQHPAEIKFPLEAQSSTHCSQSSTIPALVHWQEQLLPLSCIAEEDNLTVLRIELETAHQLLQHQQSLIDSLAENQTNQDLQLQHTQVELAATRETCDRQAERLGEVESICRDLKTQLRRQQQRVLQYRNSLNERTANPISFQPTAQSFAETMVSVGYKAIAVESHSVVTQQQHPSKASKPPAVAAWSAPESIGLTGPLACYRKLATIRMTTSMIRMESFSRGSMKAAIHSKIHPANANQTEGMSPKTQSSSQIELPSFTRSSLQ
jgi:hypothetical protein